MEQGERIVFTKQYTRDDGLILAYSGDKGTVITKLPHSNSYFVEVDKVRDRMYKQMWVGKQYLEAEK